MVERGEVFVTSETLSHVCEQDLEQANSKITDVKIETGDGTARPTGKVKEVVPMPFTIEAPITTDGTMITPRRQDHFGRGRSSQRAAKSAGGISAL